MNLNYWSFPFIISLCNSTVRAFVNVCSPASRYSTTTIGASRKAFGKDFDQPREGPEKTYGHVAPIRDMIDTEGAMASFFSTREEWLPLFRSMAVEASCQAMEYLRTLEHDLEFHEQSYPWKRLQSRPEDENDMAVLGNFLDSMQQSLLDIPVLDDSEEDENDLQFVEEGRRLLAISRFHVIRDNKGGDVESNDALFATCWSELKELSFQDENHTGSLILLPEYELSDLRRFIDMNLQRPLEWLGLQEDFEVASLQRGSPAIRLLYKLNEIPEDTYHEPEVFKL